MAVKPRLPWYISRRLYEGPNKYHSGKVAEFGGHSLNGFEVIQLFSEGSSKALPPHPREGAYESTTFIRRRRWVTS